MLRCIVYGMGRREDLTIRDDEVCSDCGKPNLYLLSVEARGGGPLFLCKGCLLKMVAKIDERILDDSFFRKDWTAGV